MRETERVNSTNAFPGFALSGYRSLSGEPQWIPIGEDVTVIIGANNSGKSNVLRLVYQHMNDLYNSITGVSPEGWLASFEERFDKPRGQLSSGLQVHWPLDLPQVARYLPAYRELKTLLEMPIFNQFGTLTIPLVSKDFSSSLTVDSELLKNLDAKTNTDWGRTAIHLTGESSSTSSGLSKVFAWLRRMTLKPPETAYVPPTRNIRTSTAATEWEFGGNGVVERLYRLKHPEFDDDALRAQAQALTQDLRRLLDEPDLEFDIPESQASLNICLGGQYFPLASVGTGTEQAVLILAARHVYPERLLCIEEPDAHLHPRLQRRLMDLLRDPGRRRIVIATHSAHIIDIASDTVVSVHRCSGRSELNQVRKPELFELLRSLGYQASDLLQANAIVWVEGPSDRIYLLHWIKALAPELVEGVDFSVVFYGGALVNRLTASATQHTDPSLVDLWRVNQRMWMVMDSDLGEGDLKQSVTRLKNEITQSGRGGVWITDGYTIENYVPTEVLLNAVRAVHPTVTELDAEEKNCDPLRKLKRKNGEYLQNPDKVGIALSVTKQDPDLDCLDLRNQIEQLVEFLREYPGPTASDPIGLSTETSDSD